MAASTYSLRGLIWVMCASNSAVRVPVGAPLGAIWRVIERRQIAPKGAPTTHAITVGLFDANTPAQ